MRRTPTLTVAYPKIAALALVAVLVGGCGSAAISTPTSTPTLTPTVAPVASTSTSPTPSPSATPTLTHSVAPPSAQVTRPPTTSPATQPPAASCYPLSNEGTCYEPGEYCRKADHGASGVAGDGKKIVCEDNNGWRWEPV